VLLDPRGIAARVLGARGLPTTIIVNRAGEEISDPGGVNLNGLIPHFTPERTNKSNPFSHFFENKLKNPKKHPYRNMWRSFSPPPPMPPPH
jgi:hypothetical protein